MYLLEALKHNVPALHEDRLTQIMAATFNASPAFQKMLLQFLRVPFRPQLRAFTQVANEHAPSRPDLILYLKDTPYILIESKIESKAEKDQLRLHSRIKAPYNFLIVRDPTFSNRVHHKFTKINWYDLFIFIQASESEIDNPLCLFLIEEFLNFGKAIDMFLPDKISSSEMRMAAAFLTQTRLRRYPQYSFDDVGPFKALESMSLFFERVLGRIKEESFLKNKVTNFSKRLKLANSFDLEVNDALRKSPFPQKIDRYKSVRITVEKQIALQRSINGYKHLFIRLEFAPYHRGRDFSDNIDISRIKSLDLEKIEYRAEVSVGLSSRRSVFMYDDCLLFDDKRDLEFEYFYGKVLRHWKKKLLVSARKAA